MMMFCTMRRACRQSRCWWRWCEGRGVPDLSARTPRSDRLLSARGGVGAGVNRPGRMKDLVGEEKNWGGEAEHDYEESSQGQLLGGVAKRWMLPSTPLPPLRCPCHDGSAICHATLIIPRPLPGPKAPIISLYPTQDGYKGRFNQRSRLPPACIGCTAPSVMGICPPRAAMPPAMSSLSLSPSWICRTYLIISLSGLKALTPPPHHRMVDSALRKGLDASPRFKSPGRLQQVKALILDAPFLPEGPDCSPFPRLSTCDPKPHALDPQIQAPSGAELFTL